MYNTQYNMFYYTCINLLKNEQDALDVTQDVYVTVLNNLYTLEDNSKFLPWLNRIAVNKCKDFMKKNKPVLMEMECMEAQFFEENENFLPEEYIINKEKREIVLNIMRSSLSKNEYETILMFYFNGLSIQEIADIMECPQGTVLSRLSSARGKIKQGVLMYEKKNDDKLYSVGFLPFITSIFVAEFEALYGMKLLNYGIVAGVGNVTAVAGDSVKTSYVTMSVDKNMGESANSTLSSTIGKVGLNAMKKKLLAGIIVLVLGGGIVAVVLNGGKDDEKGDDVKNTNEYLSDVDENTEDEIVIDGENIEEVDNETTQTVADASEEEVVEEGQSGFSGVDKSDIEGNKATIELNGEDTVVDIIYGEYDFQEGLLSYNGTEITYRECLAFLLADGWEPLFENEIVSIDDIYVEGQEQDSFYLMKSYYDESGESQNDSMLVMIYNSTDEELPALECELYSLDIGFVNCGGDITVTLPGGINENSTEADIFSVFGTPTSITENEISGVKNYVWDKGDVELTIKWDLETNQFSGFRYQHPTVDYSDYF